MPAELKSEVKYQLIEDTESLAKIVPYLEAAKTISIDTESTSLDPHQAKLLLLQIATEDKSYVIDCLKVSIDLLRPLLEADRPLKLVQNAKNDYKLLKVQAEITMGSMFDTMLAERLITCGISREISLKTLAEKYLGLNLDKEIRKSFIDFYSPGRKQVYTPEQLLYAAQDAEILLPIFKKQFQQLREDGLIETAKLEFNLVPVVGDMEIRGSLLDQKRWRTHTNELRKKRDEINDDIQKDLRHLNPYSRVDLFGNEEDSINLDSPLQLLDAFKKLGVELPNTSEATLQKTDHPLAKKLLEYRGFEKMITAFGESILEKINPVTGRLHPDFMQLGADTGRFACNNPNLQQIPAESEFRSCFIASPGYKLITADYSQIELRIMAEVSEDPAFLEAFNSDIDLHTLTASQMFRIPVESVDKNRRFQAKSINFGLMYGRGPASLGVQIGLSVDESRKLLDVYFKTYRGVKRWLDQVGKQAVKQGYIRTLGGRKRIFTLPDKDNPDYDKLIASVDRQGKNTPIQGTSADITKYALVYIAAELKKRQLDAFLIHTVHDEIVSEARESVAEEVAKLVEDQMIEAGKRLLKQVPVKVDVHIADIWTK
jgi:DNA polymerase-1